MSKKLYRILFIIGLFIALLGFLAGIFYGIFQIIQQVSISDNILFILCNLIGGIFGVFQIYSLFRSFNIEGHLINDLLYDKDKNFNKPFYIFVNVIAVLVLAGLIYDILLFFIPGLFLYDFPTALKILILSFFFLVLVNIAFIDLFPLTIKKKNDKFTLHRE